MSGRRRIMTKSFRKLTDKKMVNALVFLCAAVYFVSYVTRINYSAVLVEIMKSEGYTKTAVSVPVTGLFIVYGASQLISGYLGDKISPEKIVFSGLIISALMNLFLPFAPSTKVMTVIWSINGFAQALMWPPLVKILTEYLSIENYSKNIVYIIFGSSLGTVFVYTASPVVIGISSWKWVFFGASAVAVTVAVVWIFSIYRIERGGAQVQEDSSSEKIQAKSSHVSFTTAAIMLLGMIMFTNVFQGLLRDGISTWMPTYMADTFGFGSQSAILTGVALPVASMFISFFTAALYRKILKNEAVCTTLFFVVCTACCFVLCMSGDVSPVLSAVMLMAASAATHAINFMYTSIAVAKFERFGRMSLVTGLINSSVYIGSALSTYGIAAVAEHFGWHGTLVTWLICSVLGFAGCIASIKPFSKNL